MDKGFQGDQAGRPPFELLRAIALEAIDTCSAGRAVTRSVTASPGRLVLAGQPMRTMGAGRILVLACGKVAAPMFEAFVARLRAAEVRRPVRALIVTPEGVPPSSAVAAVGHKVKVQATWMTGEHPIPARGSFRAGQAALRFMAQARGGDDVVALISGGGSSLMAAPLKPFLNAAEKSHVHQILVVSGAPISAINAARRHLSALKGGRLAVAARRARSLTTLVVCDVDPDRYDEVASGPSVPDRTTLDDLIQVAGRYGLAPTLPPRVLEALRTGRMPETPKPRDPVFRRARAQMLLSNGDLRNAAVRAGLMRGLAAEAMPTEITGTVEAAVEMVARAIEGAPAGIRLLVLGGEVRTAPAAGGIGGRAQEMALRLAMRMRNLAMRGWAFLAIGSDGRDGNSEAAGAFVDATTLERARTMGADPDKSLQRSDTFRLFHRLGDTLMTGPTGTNVRDVYLLLTGLPRPLEIAPPPPALEPPASRPAVPGARPRPRPAGSSKPESSKPRPSRRRPRPRKPKRKPKQTPKRAHKRPARRPRGHSARRPAKRAPRKVGRRKDRRRRR